MKLLVDTQAWLWSFAQPELLTDTARAALEAEDNEIFVSAGTAWEIVIKNTIGKLPLPLPGPEYVRTRMAQAGHAALPIGMDHVLAVAELPLHHRDPFDRLLIAQARVEGMTIVSADRQLSAYDVSILWDA